MPLEKIGKFHCACIFYRSAEFKPARLLPETECGYHSAMRKAMQRCNEAVERDAARYRWLRETFATSVGGGIEVNDAKLVYEEPEPGRAVRLYWYPHTPVGFTESAADTLDEAVDEAMRPEESKDG